MAQQSIPCKTHAAKIDLGFGDTARELFGFLARVSPGNFARKRFHLL